MYGILIKGGLKKMKKMLFVVGIVVLFVGMSAFVGATTIRTDTVEQPEESTIYPIARIVLDGELEATGGQTWFGFSVGEERFFTITTQLSCTVVSGTLTATGTTKSTTLNPGETIEMNVFFGIWGSDIVQFDYLSGTAIGVTIE
jgi:hypothetical protein